MSEPLFATRKSRMMLEDQSGQWPAGWPNYWLFEDGSVICWGGEVNETVVLRDPRTGQARTYTNVEGAYTLQETENEAH